MLLQSLRKLFVKEEPSPYIAHRIEYHRRYDGTYMCFGYHNVKQQWLLLMETGLPDEAQAWAEQHGGVAVPSAGHYIACTCCPRKALE